MASNVAGSTAVWNAGLAHPEETIGDLGDLEHPRGGLGRPTLLAAGELLWLTDKTPHESLPLRAGTVRQYFWLVTREVSIWYTQRSTPNQLGIRPPEDVRLVHFSKFEDNATDQLFDEAGIFGLNTSEDEDDDEAGMSDLDNKKDEDGSKAGEASTMAAAPGE
ncbi:hypothetical protein T492DRAFT_882490 [Pavlovales sp. CCMP2436]|nr:hypothetical protein T492DRAFT_882490 [Pavlovales sp. CCMP2436]